MHRYTRTWSGQQDVRGVSADAVRSVLGAGRGRWLEAFLDAAEAASCNLAPVSGGRALARSELVADGARQFVWTPTRDPRLFRRFYGQLEVGAAAGGSVLTLAGTWFDGRAAINEAALDGLLVRLGAALEEVFEQRPRRRGIGVGSNVSDATFADRPLI